MRYLLKGFLGIMMIFFFQYSAIGAESCKIGILDFQRVFTQSNKGKRVYTALKEKQEALQSKLATKENELKELQKELEKQSLMLSLDAKEDKQKDYERKRRELQYLYQDMNDEMKKAEISAQQDMMKDLKGVIDTIVSKNKYDIIFEATHSNVVWWSGEADITEEVIAEYNKIKP